MRKLFVFVFVLLPIWSFAQSSPKVFLDAQIPEADRLRQLVNEQSPFAIEEDKSRADFVLTMFVLDVRGVSKTLAIYSWSLYDNSRRTVIASGEEMSPLDCLPKAASAVRTGWQVKQQVGLDKLPVGGAAGSGRGLAPGPSTRMDVYTVGNGVTEPIPLYSPRPNYTEEARNARIGGVIVLQAIIRKDGSVDSFKVIKGLGYGLDESAIYTIMTKWKFKPGTLEGVPVDVQADIEVTFKLFKH